MASDLEALAPLVKAALEEGDLAAYRDLLAPDVTWGPAEEPEGGCKSRREVLRWYRAGRARGVSATVSEVQVGKGCLLVGLMVRATSATGERGGTSPRWQVLTVRGGQIADIRGFEDRDAAATRAGISR